MKAKINGYEVEGSVEEFKKLLFKAVTAAVKVELKPTKPRGRYSKKWSAWTRTEDETLLRELKNGSSIARVARLLKRTRAACYNRNRILSKSKTSGSDTMESHGFRMGKYANEV